MPNGGGCGQRGPGDAERAVPGVEAGRQHDRGLDEQVQREGEEGGGDERQRPALPIFTGAGKLPNTTVLAPISMSESSPKPASATERALTAATASTAMPITFQPRVPASNSRPRRSRRRWSMPAGEPLG